MRKNGISRRKGELRGELRRERDSIPAGVRIRASQRMAMHLAASRLYRDAEVVFGYCAAGSEADLSALLLEEKGKRICFPRITGKGEMEAGLYTGTLETGAFAIPAPPKESGTVPPGEISLILCPALSVDEKGYRLGYGGGYYDRFVKKSGAVRVGVCFSKLYREDLPHESFDETMDWILTEDGLREVNSTKEKG